MNFISLNIPKSRLGSWVILVLLLVGLPVVLLANKYSQDTRTRAVQWPQTLTKVNIDPGLITTSLSSAATNLSTLAYDQYNQPIVSGITYEWGISSTNTVGTLKTHDNLAEFTPLNTGTGDLYVVARQGALNVTGSVAVNVIYGDSACIPVNKVIHVTPPGSSGACHDLQTAIDAVPNQNPQTSGPNFGYTVKIAPGTYYIPRTPNTFDVVVKNKDRIYIVGGENSKAVHLVFTQNHGGIYIDNASGHLEWMEISGLATNGLVSIRNSLNFSLGYLHLYDSGAHTLDIYNSNSISLYNSEVSSSAGGVEVGNVQNLTIANNVIHDADNGISVGASSGKIFANLISSNRESGLRLNGTNQLTISSNTIVGNNRTLANPLNTAAVFMGYSIPDAVSNITLEKNIIVGNSGVGLGVRNEDQNQVILSLSYNDAYGNAQNYRHIPDPTGQNGNISADPLFGSSGNDTSAYCLLSGSPAIYGNPANHEYMGHRGPCVPILPPITPEYLKDFLLFDPAWTTDIYADGTFNILDAAFILRQLP